MNGPSNHSTIHVQSFVAEDTDTDEVLHDTVEAALPEAVEGDHETAEVTLSMFMGAVMGLCRSSRIDGMPPLDCASTMCFDGAPLIMLLLFS